MADEAGCQPVGTGGCNCYKLLGNRLGLSASGGVREPGWTGAIIPNERAVARLQKESGVHERAQQGVTNLALETPQALRLRCCQPKSRHLNEFALDSLQHVIDTHLDLPGYSKLASYWVLMPGNKATDVPLEPGLVRRHRQDDK
jgi:hypothetical protein